MFKRKLAANLYKYIYKYNILHKFHYSLMQCSTINAKLQISFNRK